MSSIQVRTVSGYQFVNAGDLTTTFTAPTACATINEPYRGVEHPDLDGYFLLGLGSCSSVEPDAQCTPHGEVVESLYQRWDIEADADYLSPRRTSYHEFYSPGLACPSAWETVGVASNVSGTIDATGVFSPTAFQLGPGSTTTRPLMNFPFNALTSVLGPSETAIVCCPSGYTAHPWNGCYSTFELADLESSVGCQTVTDESREIRPTSEVEVFEYFGETITYTAPIFVAVTEEASSSLDRTQTTRIVTYTLDESGSATPEIMGAGFDVSATAGLAQVRPIILVNSGEERDGSEEGEEGENGEDGDGDGGESGAQSRFSGSAAVVSVLAAIWTVGFLAVCNL